MFGPTTGDRVRLADTELFIEVERDLTIYGEEVKFGGGKVIRDGMGQSQMSQRPGRGGHGDHQRADPGPLGRRERRCRDQGWADRRDRQGGQSGRTAGRRHHHRPGDGDHRRRRQDPDRGRHRQPYSFHLSATGRGGAGLRHHDDDRRRHRPGDGNGGDDVHAGAVAPRAHAASGRGAAGQSGIRRQGQCVAARRAGRDGASRRVVPEAARRLGHHAGGNRLRACPSRTGSTSR